MAAAPTSPPRSAEALLREQIGHLVFQTCLLQAEVERLRAQLAEAQAPLAVVAE